MDIDGYSSEETKFLDEQLQYMQKYKPYTGMSIVHNIPLSVEAVAKVQPLLVSGARVTVTPMASIVPKTKQKAMDILRRSNVDLREQSELAATYDFVLDCGAELARKVYAKEGVVELTRSGAIFYESHGTTVPVLSVDGSKTKQLETFYGTGDAFVRGVNQFIDKDISEYKVLLFGYGKVGQGIVYACDKAGVNQVYVVDSCNDKIDLANSLGCHATHFANTKKLHEAIKQSDIVVTATGITNFISNNFEKDIFANKILCNMGANDEYGAKFSNTDVLYDKSPINFSLDEPTKTKYLDPIFCAHNYGIKWIREFKMNSGLHNMPAHLDEEFINQWEQFYEYDVEKVI